MLFMRVLPTSPDNPPESYRNPLTHDLGSNLTSNLPRADSRVGLYENPIWIEVRAPYQSS